jgi:hypothetical protein
LTFSFIVGTITAGAENRSFETADAPLAIADDFIAGTSMRVSEIPEAIGVDVVRNSNHIARRHDLETDLYTVAFANDDGTNTMYLFGEPVRYIADDGSVRDISNRLFGEFNTGFCSEKYAYVNLENSTRTYFPRTLGNGTGVLLTDSRVEVELIPTTRHVSRVENRSDNNNWLYYDGTFGVNTATRYMPTFEGFKYEVVLFENAGNEFRFTLNTNGLRAVQSGNQIELLDPETGENVGDISPVYVYDSFEGIPQVGNVHSTYNNEMRLIPLRGGNYELLIIVDEEFLSNPNTVYPVYVDPTIRLNGANTTNGHKNILDLPVYNGNDVRNSSAGRNSTAVLGYVGTSGGNYHGSGRLLMRFPGLINHPGFSRLPVNDVTAVRLHMWSVSGSGAAVTIQVNHYTGVENWTETTTSGAIAPTWNTATGTLVGSVSVGGPPTELGGTNGIDITAAWRTWRSNPAAGRRGLILRNATNETNDHSRHRSLAMTENGTASRRPAVSVTVREIVHTARIIYNGVSLTETQMLSNYNNAVASIRSEFGIRFQPSTPTSDSRLVGVNCGCNALGSGVSHRSASALLNIGGNNNHTLRIVAHLLCGDGEQVGGVARAPGRESVVTTDWFEPLTFLIQHELSHNLGVRYYDNNNNPLCDVLRGLNVRCAMGGPHTDVNHWCDGCRTQIWNNRL